MRIHGNFLEQLPLIIVCIVIGGFTFPLIIAGVGILNVLARIIYGIGYFIRPQKRLAGALIGDVIILALVGLAVTSLVTVLLQSKFIFPISTCLLLAFECVCFGFFVAGGKRGKYFTKEFFNKFEKDQQSLLAKSKSAIFGKEATQEEIGEGGYPDEGSGRFSLALTYD